MSPPEPFQAQRFGSAVNFCSCFSGKKGACLAIAGKRRSGYTLLELVVVMVIIAALAALVVPNLDRVADDAELTVARANLSTIREAITGSASASGYFADMRYVPGFDPLEFRLHDLLSDSLPTKPLYDITLNRGWRGPYLQRFPAVQNTNRLHEGLFPAANDRRRANDPTFFERGFFYDTVNSFYGLPGVQRSIGDAWGNPIILQVPPEEAFVTPSATKRWRYARLVSAGPDGVLSTPRYDASIPVLQTRRDEARLAGRLSDGTLVARGDDLVLFLNRVDVYEVEEP